MDSSVSQKDQFWFLRVCRHVSRWLYNLDPLHLSQATPRSHILSQFSLVYIKPFCLDPILGTSPKLRKATVSFITGLYFCPSVIPNETPPLPLNRFHEIWYSGFFSPKIFREDTIFRSVDKNNGYSTWRTVYNFFNYISLNLLAPGILYIWQGYSYFPRVGFL